MVRTARAGFGMLVVMGMCLFSGKSAVAHGALGQLQVIVYDAAGQLAMDAPVFIVDESGKMIREPQLTRSISIPNGRYQVYSAIARPHGSRMLRLKSHVAFASVSAGGVETVILTLLPFNPAREYAALPITPSR